MAEILNYGRNIDFFWDDMVEIRKTKLKLHYIVLIFGDQGEYLYCFI